MKIFFDKGKNKYTLSVKLLSILLAAIMFLSPVTVFAQTYEEAEISSSENNEEIIADDYTASDENEVLYEEIDKREENVKYFRMKDGTVMAAQYSSAVHYNQDGKWLDYDNTLREVDDDDPENLGKLIKNKDIVNHTSDYSVRLSKKTNGKKFVRIEKDGYKISWYYSDAKKSTARIADVEDDNDPLTLENTTSTVVYNDVFKNTDLEYIIGTQGVKENIILNSKNTPTEFEAVYKANGLTPVQIDDKTIHLQTEDGKTVYTISAPFMYDANREYSDGISLSVSNVKNNTFTVTTSLDSEWLQADEREYPVLVDPMLKTKQDPSKVDTTFVSSNNPNTCYRAPGYENDRGSFYVGNKIYEFGNTESYIKFNNLPVLSVADKVVNATLYIGLLECVEGMTVNLKRLKDDWKVNTVTWNNGPYGVSQISDYKVIAANTKNKFCEFEITDMVRGWYSEEYPNYGFSLTTEKTSPAKAWFYSDEYTTYPQNRPILTVTYRNMSGYEDYWSYTNMSAGRGGTASVNNYNGNLVYSQPVTQDAGGNLMPVNISFVYNSNRNSEVKYTKIGSHFQTNYHIFLHKESGELWDNGYKYYLNDADGTRHWFYFGKSTTDGKDEDGLGYSLKVITVDSDETEPAANYIITDKDKNKMYFDKSCCLLRITNAAGISATVQYKTVSGVRRIDTVTDGAGRAYKFSYMENYPDWIKEILDPSGRKTELTYNGNNLSKLTFADGNAVTIDYQTDNEGIINKILGIDNNRIKAEYDSSKQKRILSVDWGSSDSNLLEKYSFEYKQNETTVTDIQSRSYTYQFNDFGQTTGVVSNTDGTAQAFKFKEGNNTSNTANKLISESKVLKSTTNYVINPGFDRGLESFWQSSDDSTGVVISADNSKSNITKSSLKVSKPASNAGGVYVGQTIKNLPAGTYTLSGYINTNNAEISGSGVQLYAQLRDPVTDEKISNEGIEKTTKTDGWERRSVTFDVQKGGTVRVIMGFGASGSGTVWFDDIQLEKSANPSSFNLVENSAFTNGLKKWTTWSSDASTVTYAGLTGFANCIKLTGSVENKYKNTWQYLPVSGKKGDVFTYGMWAYAFSAPLNDSKKDDGYTPAFELTIDYYDTNNKWLGVHRKSFNPELKNKWQFLSDTFVIPADYGQLAISLIYDHNVNNAYQTGSFCYKERYGQTYTYDNDGNVISAVDLAKTSSSFSYYGGQMAKMVNPSGSRYMYAYNGKKQLTTALSTDGLEYGFTYDDKGNVTKAKTTARHFASEIEDGKEYYIVNSYSGNTIHPNTGNKSDDAISGTYSSSSINSRWKARLVPGTKDVYEFKSVAYPTMYLDVRNASKETGAFLQIFPENNKYAYAQQFKLVRQTNGTFAILTGTKNYTLCLDGQYDSATATGPYRKIKQNTYNENAVKEGQKWYFYPVEATDEHYIITQTEYTDSKNFVSATKNQRDLATYYTYDEQKGTLQNVTDTLGNKTSYAYDENNDALTSVTSGGMTNSYTYVNDRLKEINVNDATHYLFNYDTFGRTTANKVGNGSTWKTLSSIEYDKKNGLMSKQTYGNGNYYDFTYDKLDRITQKRYNGDNSKRVTYSYGNTGNTAQITDYYTNTHTNFVYDLADRVVSQREYSGTGTKSTTLVSSTDFTYSDTTNYLTAVTHTSPLGTQKIKYAYGNISNGNMPDQVYIISWNGQNKISNTFDAFGRLVNKKVGAFNNTYTYYNFGTARTTTLCMSVDTPAGKYEYSYDRADKIKSYFDGTDKSTYEYDALDQLVRENNPRTGKTYTYSYKNGNITERKEYAYTTGGLGAVQATKKWTYGNTVWKDLLTNFNGEAITYDAIGNPTKIGTKTLTWNGRQLAQYVNGSNTISYTYNGNGQRTSKTVNGTKTDYYYNGSILAGQKTGSTTLVFMYDNNGDAFGFIYGGKEYYYVKNLQNDVTAITNSAGKVIANYYYDSWGNITSITGSNTTIANINPLRYRTYYYDTETNLYYLNSRYYSPDMCRFINADNLVISVGGNTLGNNLFAYCMNCPTNMSDNSGNAPQWLKKAVKWTATNILKPVVKTVKQVLSKVDLTYSTGHNISGSPSFWNFNGQIGISFDTKGNIALQVTGGGGITTGSPSLSFTRFRSITNAPNISELEGSYCQIGGSAATMVLEVPIAVGGDAMIIPSKKNNRKYYGLTGNVGIGLPGKELHVEWGETITLINEINIYDVAEEIYIKIMEW